MKKLIWLLLGALCVAALWWIGSTTERVFASGGTQQQSADRAAQSDQGDNNDQNDNNDQDDQQGEGLYPGLVAEAPHARVDEAGICWLYKLDQREIAQRLGKLLYRVDGTIYLTATGERAPVVALTFDDGPGIYTEELVEALHERGIRASFFMLGVRAASGDYDAALTKMVEYGNQPCLHSWDHSTSLVDLDEAEIDSELARADEAIFKVCGVHPRFVRPTYGEIDSITAACVDYPMMLWTLDTRDWDVRDAAAVCSSIVDGVYDGAVVLMHDIYSTTVEGVLAAVDQLVQQGYQFVTLDEYYDVFGLDPQPGEVWRGSRPADI